MSAQPASSAALRLLEILRAQEADRARKALTDRAISALGNLPQRDIVDLAGELLEHGFLVLATCGKSPGRFLLSPGADLAPARAYLRSLTHRALKIMHRRRLVRRVIELAESGRSPDSTGQLRMFPSGTAVPGRVPANGAGSVSARSSSFPLTTGDPYVHQPIIPS